MSALSQAAVKSLAVALANNVTDNEVIQAVAAGRAHADQAPFVVAAVIVATNVSQTIDFAALAVGDKVVVIPAAAGNSHFVSIATAGTLGEAAVVGSLYVALRARVEPAASATTPIF